MKNFPQLQDLDNLASLDNATHDTLVAWMNDAIDLYDATLQTMKPDLSGIQTAGGKILHFQGEQDSSIAAGSSMHFYEAVRGVMYPGTTFNESVCASNHFYRFYLVLSAEHCGPNSAQANGFWPNTNLAVMIDSVENGVAPDTLNATVLQGGHQGETRELCRWPLRRCWTNDETMAYEYDQDSIDSWMYTFDAFKRPIYQLKCDHIPCNSLKSKILLWIL